MIALATFLLTLSSGLYPGYSTSLIAAAVGLTSPSGVDHPVFALLLRLFASTSVLSLPVTLNLFSALCGALCTVVLYHWIANLILFFACETQDGCASAKGEGRSSVSELSPEMILHNRRMVPLAIMGGFVAALLLTFMVPLWSVSTRAHPAAFDLLLALTASDLLFMSEAASRTYARNLRLALSCFLFAVGLFESAIFLFILPFYFFFAGLAFYFSSRKRPFLLAVTFGWATGIECALFAFYQNWPAPGPGGIGSLLLAIASHHYHELLSFLPQTGWFLFLFQTALPALILLFSTTSFFGEKQRGRFPALILVTLSSIPSLLNLSFSPRDLLPYAEHLTVFACAVTAAATAITIATCLKMVLYPDGAREAKTTTVKGQVFRTKNLSEPIIRFCVSCLPVLLFLLGVLSPWCSFRDTSTRESMFADEIARSLITQMGNRTWLVSNGLLDNHLLIQARLLKHPLTLVPMRQRIPPGDLRTLEAAIDSDPIFEGQNRMRLQNALSVGAARFIMEWFKTDPQVTNRVMVFASPDIWTACGYRAIPEGLAFGGISQNTAPDVAKIIELNRHFDNQITQLLVPRKKEPDSVAALRDILQTRAGFAANELGVFFEETDLAEEAYQAYMRACRIDPMNFSAAVNAYALATSRKVHPEEVNHLRKNIKVCASNSLVKNMPFSGIQQTYGTIRQKDFYRQQIALWSSTGVPLAAADKIGKSAALSKHLDASALADNAVFFLQAGMLDKAEACCRAALAKDSTNHATLCALATLSLTCGKLDEAATWLEKAKRGGTQDDAFLYQTITLSLLRKDDAQAQLMLEKATKEYPSDIRYWFLLAEVLLRQNATQEVEFTVLPAIQKALNSPNHYLPHVVRGYLLRKKGASNYKAARLELLQAVSMNALLTDVWNVIFELDLALNNFDFMESDAQRQLTVDPDHALANYLLGTINLMRGELKRSEDFLRRSIEKKPTAAACNDLAENLRQQKRLTEAEPFARQALAIQADLSPALDTLACILLETQRVDEAAQHAEQANNLSPKTPVFQLTLLRIRVKQNNRAEMDHLLHELEVSKTPLPETLQREINLLRKAPAPASQHNG